jgi:hypothetical protein
MSALFESIATLPTPFNMIVFIVLIGSAAGVMAAVAKEVRIFLCHRDEMELKREMLDRGMGVGEIDRAMQAKSMGKR